jgi:hypothetical protein
MFRKLIVAVIMTAAAVAVAKEAVRIATAPAPQIEEVSSVVLKGFNWAREGIAFRGSFTVENLSPFDVKDVELYCTHYAPSGTVLDTSRRKIYEIFYAKSAKMFRNQDMGIADSQVAKLSCFVAGYAPYFGK